MQRCAFTCSDAHGPMFHYFIALHNYYGVDLLSEAILGWLQIRKGAYESVQFCEWHPKTESDLQTQVQPPYSIMNKANKSQTSRWVIYEHRAQLVKSRSNQTQVQVCTHCENHVYKERQQRKVCYANKPEVWRNAKKI